MKLWSILGNSQKLDGGAMFGNVPKAMWASRRACVLPSGSTRDGERPAMDGRAGATHQGRFEARCRKESRDA
ncbi:MAG TPA: hypothetical protein VFL14_09450 [Xanthomonadales bacterium]|nr:hypothetical protein [Xanthomonadales bacterium]